MAHELRTELELHAAPVTVWAALTDLAASPACNPFITSMEGTLAVGERLVSRIEPPGGKALTFRPVITGIDEDRVVEWFVRLGVPRLFDGRHRFELGPDGGSTRLIQTERSTGVLVPLPRRSVDARTRAGFEAMNTALRARAEATD